MTTPSTPYCTSAQVAAFARSNLKGGMDFSASSIPTKDQVDNAIDLVSGQIDMNFRMAGYKIPFVAISGETWPTDQTIYLSFVAAVGATALAVGHAANPAPALGPTFLRGTGNVYQDLFTQELMRIYQPGPRFETGQTHLRFRAQYYPETPAQFILRTPKAPTTDFMENRHDPMATLDNRTAASAVVQMWNQIASQTTLDWNYIRGLFDINKGFSGTSRLHVEWVGS